MNFILSRHSLKIHFDAVSKVINEVLEVNYQKSLKKLERLIGVLNSDLISEDKIELVEELTIEEIQKAILKFNKEILNRKDLQKTFYYIKREISLGLDISKFLSSLKRVLRFLININSNYKRDKRLSIRKIYTFHFKNLDDYHSYSIL